MHCTRLYLLALALVFITLPTSAATPTPTAEAAAPSPADPARYPIRGDVNRDCIVNILDILGLGQGGPDADVSGDGVVDQVDYDLVQAVFGSTCGMRLLGEINGDGVVNVIDLLRLFGAWGSAEPRADIDGDGSVGSIDLNLLLANWGRTLGHQLIGDVNGTNVVNVQDLLALLSDWGQAPSAADINLDGTVDETDLALLKANWGATSGTDLRGDIDGSCVVGPVDLDISIAVYGTYYPAADIEGDDGINILDVIAVISEWDRICGEKLVGDVNGDWQVDSVDRRTLRALLGSTAPKANHVDLNRDGAVDDADLELLDENFGATFGTTFTGDINGDCVVNEQDKALLLAVWDSDFPPADLNGDGTVNYEDLTLLLGNLGETCSD